MSTRFIRSLCLGAGVLVIAGCGEDSPPMATEGPAEPEALAETAIVDGQRIIDADATPGEWLTHGRTYSERREDIGRRNGPCLDRTGC